MGKAGKTFLFNGVSYDSPEETYFAMWLLGLEKAGFINKWLRNEKSFEITQAVKNSFGVKKLSKTSRQVKDKTQTILQGLSYTPDFIVVWNKSAKGLFYNELNQNTKISTPFIAQQQEGLPTSIVEIKPSFDRNNMTRLFRQVQKFLYDKFSVFVNLIMIEKLFSETYTPYTFLFTKTGNKKVIKKWKPISLDEYLKKK